MKKVKNINFSMVKERAREALSGNWLMFSMCLVFTVLVFMLLLPARYIFSFVQPETVLTVSDLVWVFIATVASESLMFVFTAAMYSVIFQRSEAEKKGIGLIFKRANLLFPSTVMPILLTRVSFSVLSFLFNPVVTEKLYDYLFLTMISYRAYVILIGVLSLAVSVLSYVVMIMYIFTPCIIADNPEISGLEALKKSRILLKRRKINMLWFIISFAVWYIAGMMCFGLGMIWAHAYMLTSVYIYYKECIKEE